MTVADSPATVTALRIAPGSRLPMNSVDHVDVKTGGGIVGDRYENSRHRHVTVQSQQQLDEASEQFGAVILPEHTRRNITVSTGEVPVTPGDRFAIGEVELEVVRIPAPCKLLEDDLGPGVQTALRRRAGTVCRVLQGGRIEIGTPVVDRPS